MFKEELIHLRYGWSSSQNNGLFTGLAAGNYLATITDAMGCTVDTSAIIGQPVLLEIDVIRVDLNVRV